MLPVAVKWGSSHARDGYGCCTDKSLFDRSHDANICQQIRHFGNIQQKECFLQFRMLHGWRTHIYFSTLNTASGNKGCHTHSLQLLRLPCFFERDVCWAEFDRQKVGQVSKIASRCFKNLNNPGNLNRARHYRYLQIVFIFTSDGLQQSHVFLCASVALEARRGNFAPPPSAPAMRLLDSLFRSRTLSNKCILIISYHSLFLHTFWVSVQWRTCLWELAPLYPFIISLCCSCT